MTSSAARRPWVDEVGDAGVWTATPAERATRRIFMSENASPSTSSTGTLTLTLVAVRVGGRAYLIGGPASDGRAVISGRSA